MKRFLLLLTCLTGIIYTNGQIIIAFNKDKKRSKILASVHIKSIFPGGDTSWRSYLEKNLNASMEIGERAKKGKYIVVVKFIVAKDGTIADIMCENDPGYNLCEETIRLIKKRKKWGQLIR